MLDAPSSLNVAPKRMSRPVDGGFDPFQHKVYPPCDSLEELPVFPLSRGAVDHLHMMQTDHWEGADDLGSILLGHQEGCSMFLRNSVCVCVCVSVCVCGGDFTSHGVGLDA